MVKKTIVKLEILVYNDYGELSNKSKKERYE